MLVRVAVVVGFIPLTLGCSKLRAKLTQATPSAVASASVAAPAPSATPAQPVASTPLPPAAGDVAVPTGYARMRVAGVTRLPHGGDAVLLVEEGRKRAVPIFIGGTEALSIQLRLKKQPYVRPLTHDLLDASIQKLGARVESVRIDKIESNVFHGTLVLVSGSGRIELDARPSDAIAIAIGNAAPIHVARPVIDHAGLDLDDQGTPSPGVHGERPPPVSL
jgi:bifunctional DNase/RNase